MVRAVLLLGLFGHKLLWEFLKTSEPARGAAPTPPGNASLRLLKGLKVLALLGIVVQTLCMNLWPIAKRPWALTGLGLALYVLGLSTAVAGRLRLGRSWTNLEDAPPSADRGLVTGGIYGLIRHPIYTGDLLLLVGLELALNSWLVLGAFIPMLIVVRQTLSEERQLRRLLPAYEDYRRRTKMFLPFIV